MTPTDIVLTVADLPPDLDDRLFQLHVLPGNRIRLVPCEVVVDLRCPILVKGERCGRCAGHQGKHCWRNGD